MNITNFLSTYKYGTFSLRCIAQQLPCDVFDLSLMTLETSNKSFNVNNWLSSKDES